MSSRELRDRLRDVHAYVVTPFNREDPGRIDMSAQETNVGFLIEQGVKVLNIGGGTGEVNALSNAELTTLTQSAFYIAGPCTLVVPTLPGNLGDAMELAPAYERMGALVALAMAPSSATRRRTTWRAFSTTIGSLRAQPVWR